MYKLKSYLLFFIAATILFNESLSSSAMAVPVFLSSGQVFDLTAKQVELLKQESGISFFPYQPKKFIKGRIQPLVLVKLPEVFGGGFLISTPKNMETGLKMIGATEKEEIITENASSKAKVAKRVEPRIETEFLLSTGYRIDDLDWNIAGDIYGNNPNILSELTWSNIEIYQLIFRNKTILHEVFCLRGSLGYGWIFDGENQDSDFWGDNRTIEFSRSNNSTNDGNTLDASFGIGYQFTFVSGNLAITPLIGYSYHKQNLAITDGYQTIPATGSFQGLDSTYNAEWRGPWVGLNFIFKSNKNHNVFAEIEYHWADYDAEADWNLRIDLAHPKSFEHDADGNGIVISAGWGYSFNNHWALSISFDHQVWSADAGIDRVFFANGITQETRLNEVNWKSHATMIRVAYNF